MTLLDFLEAYWLFLVTGVFFPATVYALKTTFAHKGDLDIERMRINNLESRVDNLPSAKDFHSLSEKIVSIAGDIRAMNSDMMHVKKNVDMLVEKELRGK